MDSTGSLDEIARKTAETSSFKEVVNRLTSGEKQVPLQGLPDSLLSFLLTHVQRSIRKPMLVVASDEDTAERWRDDLQAVAGEDIGELGKDDEGVAEEAALAGVVARALPAEVLAGAVQAQWLVLVAIH